MRKWRGLWQTTQSRSNPGTVTLRKVLRIGQIATRRHRQNGFALTWMNAQRVAARSAMAPELNCINRGADFDGEGAGFGRTAVKKCAKDHVSSSGQQEFAGILPYPPPVKFIGAKTNHLPNISWI
jgi:hypothetical protein